jgi:metal-responsive CopG/Arc/MetJ family transcriptional regulator
VNVWLTAATAKHVDYICEYDGTNRSALIRQALDEYLALRTDVKEET